MCLDRIDKKTRKNFRYGYKIYDLFDGKLSGVFYNYFKDYPEGVWIKDDKQIIINEVQPGYPTGFHVLTSKKGAKSWKDNFKTQVIRKVLIKDIVASGTQNGFNVVVCKQKKILPGNIT